jgi:hypothetical protein
MSSMRVSAGAIPAKYEGGMYGFANKETGTLRFDDENQRLVFFGKDLKEKFSLPYRSIVMAAPTAKSVRSAAGTAGSVVPLPGASLLGLIKEKRHYLLLQFDDPDVVAQGSVTFKVGDSSAIDSTARAVAKRAGLTPRGDAFYRPKGNTDTEK